MPQEVPWEKLVEDVGSAVLTPERFQAMVATPEGRAAISGAINERIVEVKTTLMAEITSERELRTVAEKKVAELIERMERRTAYERGAAFHVGRDGKTLEPSISDESAAKLGEIFRALGRKDLTAARAFQDATASRDVSSASDSGGVFIPVSVATEIIRLIPLTGLYPKIAMDFPMGTEQVNIGAVIGGMHAYWPDQNTPITPSFPGFDKVVLIAKQLAAYIPVPLSLVEDAVINFGQLIADLVRQCLALEIDRVGIAGKSAANGGTDPFDGLLFTPDINVMVLDNNRTSMVGSLDDPLDMQNMLPDGARDNASYILHPSYFNFLRKLKTSFGDYIYQKPTDDLPGLLWGKPYWLSFRMPEFTKNAVPSTRFLLYGDWKRFAFYGHRNTMNVSTSDVAGDLWIKVQIGTRGIIRVGFASFGPAIAVMETAAS
jgi:HK97 family phage major capsid protein